MKSDKYLDLHVNRSIMVGYLLNNGTKGTAKAGYAVKQNMLDTVSKLSSNEKRTLAMRMRKPIILVCWSKYITRNKAQSTV